MELKRMLQQVLQVVQQVQGKRQELVLVMDQRVMLKPLPSLVQGQQQLEVGSQRLTLRGGLTLQSSTPSIDGGLTL